MGIAQGMKCVPENEGGAGREVSNWNDLGYFGLKVTEEMP
jgi:hypothetical protein